MQSHGGWSALPVLRLLLFRHSSRASACQQQHNGRHLGSSTSAGGGAPVCYEDDQHRITAASLPSAVWECLHQLRAAGHEVLLVGGAVRDLLLQCGEPKDYDILTSAQLKQVKDLFSKARVFGKNFPICQLDRGGVKIEISSMHTRPGRTCGAAAAGYSSTAIPPDVAEHLLGAGAAPGRGRRSNILPHMQQQQAVSWAAARRRNSCSRDFTVNALLYDPFQAVLFDYVGGMADARQRLLRCVGDPGQRFSADPACLLRAVRCAARAGLELEPATAAALQRHAHLAASLNPQRITAELMALLAYGAAAPSLALLQQVQLMQHILPLHHAYNTRLQQQTITIATSRSSSSSSSSSAQPDCGTVLAARPASSAAGSELGQFLACGPAVQRLPASRGVPSTRASRQQVYAAAAAAAAAQPQQQAAKADPGLLQNIATALDQLVSVRQPAAAEVLLACLTAPLLLDLFHGVLKQLLQLQQQQQQQQLVSSWQHQEQEERQGSGTCKAEQELQPSAALDASQLLLQQQVQQVLWLIQQPAPTEQHVQVVHGPAGGCANQGSVASVARAFSSSSSSMTGSSSSGRTANSRRSSRGTVGATGNGQVQQLHNAATECPAPAAVLQQLLQGAAVEDVLHEQAVELAQKVCTWQPSLQPGSALFGASTPRLAADLLATHIRLCRSSRKQQQLQPVLGRHTTQPCGEADRSTRGSSSSSSSSSSCSSSIGTRHHQQQHSQQHDWMDFEGCMPPPRTNKQYKRLMQQQQQHQAVMAGSVGSIPTPDALILAAALAASSAGSDSESDSCSAAAGAAGHCWSKYQHQVAGVGLSSEEYLLHQVLMYAGCAAIDLDALCQGLSR